MTDVNNIATVNVASASAEALKDKSVRATSLKAGDSYIAAIWSSPKTYSDVTFIGFGRSKDALLAGIPQLKTLTVNDKFYFLSNGEELVADGRNAGALFVGEGAGNRMTFFKKLSAETAAVVETVFENSEGAETVVQGDESVTDEETVVEAPVEEAVEVVAETHTETFGEKMKRLKAEKAARLAAEAAAIEAQIEAAV